MRVLNIGVSPFAQGRRRSPSPGEVGRCRAPLLDNSGHKIDRWKLYSNATGSTRNVCATAGDRDTESGDCIRSQGDQFRQRRGRGAGYVPTVSRAVCQAGLDKVPCWGDPRGTAVAVARHWSRRWSPTHFRRRLPKKNRLARGLQLKTFLVFPPLPGHGRPGRARTSLVGAIWSSRNHGSSVPTPRIT